MAQIRTNRLHVAFLAGIIIASGATGAMGQRQAMSHERWTRQVTFKLSFLNRDLIWLGDPASPTALCYPKPGARPIATDAFVTTRQETKAAPARRYFNEARVATEDGRGVVYAFTNQGEKRIGTITKEGAFAPDAAFKTAAERLPSWPRDPAQLKFDADRQALFVELDVPGPTIAETLDHLPLHLLDSRGNPVVGDFSVRYTPPHSDTPASQTGLALLFHGRGKPVVLAKAPAPVVLRREDLRLGSFDNSTKRYRTEAGYRPGGAAPSDSGPAVTLTVPGEFTWLLGTRGRNLVFNGSGVSRSTRDPSVVRRITIDGRFDDWRNLAGVDDPRGDVAPYLDYSPDVDILEFKVTHDDRRIYFYTRVAGRVGRSHPQGGRSYFYVYMDVDRNAATGYRPSRDDECYFGVDLGDDCEVQFEFVGNALRKTFYGFCGRGGPADVLNRRLTLGPGHYRPRTDAGAVKVDNVKIEYTVRDGRVALTKDLQEGSSDTIHVAISPDGCEVEVSSLLDGFLKDKNGRPLLGPGQSIDLAVGMECDSKAHPENRRWAADSSPIIRGYVLSPSPTRTASARADR